MEQSVVRNVAAGLCLLLLLVIAPLACAAEKMAVITKEELKKVLGDPGVTVIDVRVERDRKSGGPKIKGAVWEDPFNVDAWAGNYSKDRTIVLYCS